MNIPCDCSCKELIIFIVLKLYHTSYSEESMWEDNRMADPICLFFFRLNMALNHLTPNDHYMGRTAQLTSRCCILYIYSTNIRTEYFKHAALSPFFFSSKCRLFHNATFFGSCIFHVLNTECAKI